MRTSSVTLGLLFGVCSCAFGVVDSWIQPEWIEDLKNVNNNEDSQPRSSLSLKNEDLHSLNSKGNNVILSVTREPEEDVTDVYSLEDNEHDNTESEQTEQDDIPIIISSEPIQEEAPVILSSSSESSEKHRINNSEVPSQTLEPISSDKVLKRLDTIINQITAQERIINELKKNNKILKDKFDHIDSKIKVNNVIFMNIREAKHENYKSLVQKVLQILNRIMRIRVNTSDIVMACRINNRNTDQFRPVVVTFTNFSTKLKILANRNKLKKSKFDILDDYSELINQKRTLLLPFLYEKRRQGHKVSMVQDGLIVNGVKKSLSDLHQERSRKIQEEESKPKVNQDKNSQDNQKEEKIENGA